MQFVRHPSFRQQKCPQGRSYGQIAHRTWQPGGDIWMMEGEIGWYFTNVWGSFFAKRIDKWRHQNRNLCAHWSRSGDNRKGL